MSQEELAEKLNVSRQAVSKWESGNGYPETEKIIYICEIFNCSMDQLVKGKISNDIKSEKNNYDLIIIDTTSECFFDYTKEILEKSDIIIFLAQANLIELKKSKNLLDIYINR